MSSTLYVITPSRSKTSELLYKASQVAYVCHYMHDTWHHIHTLWQQPLEFMTSHALYSLHHMHYIWQLIYSAWCHIHYVCYITQCLYLWHQTLYVCDIFTLYGITHSVMTTQTLCAFTATMPDITLSVLLTWHTMYQFYEKKWLHVITASICMTPYALHMTSHPLFLASHHFIHEVKSTISNHIQSIWPHVHCICVITPTLSMISQPPYIWYHIQYTCDILSTIFMTSYPLCMTTQHCM